MGDVDDYLGALPDGAERLELERLHRLISGHVPGVEQATSYSMPCYTYRGVPLAAVILRRKHIAWYPYSGSVLSELVAEVEGFSHSAGTLRFTASHTLPAALVEQLLDVRMRLIDERLGDSI